MTTLKRPVRPGVQKWVGEREEQKGRETAKLVLYASRSLLGKCETRWNVGSIKPGCALLCCEWRRIRWLTYHTRLNQTVGN
jgi:hypothetical protein